MDGHRGYSDEAESQWYSGQQGYQDGDWDRQGDGGWRDDLLVPGSHRREYPGSDSHPESGTAHLTRPLESPTNPLAAVSDGGVGLGAISPGPLDPGSPAPGLPAPGSPAPGSPGRGPGGIGSPAAPPAMPGPPAVGSPLSGPPAAASPLSGPPPMAGPPPAHGVAQPREGVYRTRRPALAVLYLIGVVLCEWPAIRLFADGAFGDNVVSSNTVCGLFLIIGLPLFGRGLFALQAGAGRIPDQLAGHGWFRPPVAYLTVGLVLLLAAGLAA